MKNFLLLFLFIFFTCSVVNAQICVECPLNNCAYCFENPGGGGDEFEEPGGGGGGGGAVFCNYHIGISGGAYANVTIHSGSCSGYVTLDPYPSDNSGSFFCRIDDSQVSCYRTQGGYYSSYFFTVSHTQACGLLGFDLYFNYADTFYAQCFG